MVWRLLPIGQMTWRRALAVWFALGSVVGGTGGSWRLAAAQPRVSAPVRFYVAVRGVVDPNGQPFADAELQTLFTDGLRRRGDTTLTAPAWLPSDAARMRLELARHGMRAYEAYLKVRSLSETIEPLVEDATRRRVTVEIDVQLVGSTLPDHVLKIGGDGNASTTILVGETVDVAAVTRRLRREVAAAAIDAALAHTEEKLQQLALRER